MELWRFTDDLGSFESNSADQIKNLYFPLANEVLMSSVSPDLHGDIKASQDSFLLNPVSRQDLTDLKASRNFWIYPVRNTKKTGKENKISNGVYINKEKFWSATGVSKNLKQIEKDRFNLKAGLLWHKITRENKNLGLRAEILSFIPNHEPVEVMQVQITNISKRRIKFIPTAAIPIYGRSAENLRDHRQVTSLLHRIWLDKFGVILKPTLIFNESGHRPNKTIYFVLGWDQDFHPPQYLYPTQEMFCGDSSDLETPIAILKNLPPKDRYIQGKEAMGALRFRSQSLLPGESKVYLIIMGITEQKKRITQIINKFNNLEKVENSLKQTSKFWVAISEKIKLSTSEADFDNWFRWVSIQPRLRRIFGCSFLPDFDYGKGGRGWRDLWQDCLELILNEPKQARNILISNFSGVRVDGSNATIIGRKPGEFRSDRNNISRVWMDHGIWPLFTLNLYLNETADFDILFNETSYFRNHEIHRAHLVDHNWNPAYGQKLKTRSGKVYQGTILEHLLIENLVQFFNVGSHNYIRLEGADWNDGLDMAKEYGESVAFSGMYAWNLKILSDLLYKIAKKKIKLAKEIKILLKEINFSDIREKHKILNDYFARTKSEILGEKVNIEAATLADDLKAKSDWLSNHIREREWLKLGFFNGYYDNRKQRAEGSRSGVLRMMLASQVFPIMSEVAQAWQVRRIFKSVNKFLFDRKLKGYHLNSDFSRRSFKTSGGIPPKAGKEGYLDLGRAFSFAYGDKENGAFFNHMILMFAYSLYKRGFVKQGWRVFNSIYNMTVNTSDSKIYPGLPEYFNLQGQGMYSYLTGSASWFVLTLISEIFGIKGKSGDLLVEPKLTSEQFKRTPTVTIEKNFAGRRFCISFTKPRSVKKNTFKIVKASLNLKALVLREPHHILIKRKAILKLPKKGINNLSITLG